jgi:hypothetical protein
MYTHDTSEPQGYVTANLSLVTSPLHREPIAIGWHARKLWLGMDAGARSSHTFVECFKLALKDPARAALPSWLTAEQVRW